MEESENTKPQEDKQETQGTKFEQAIHVWNEINLPSLQKKLDDEGIQMMENQKTSVVGRKELAAKTKSFKKLEDSEKLEEIKGLLKLYQTEVDSLTNRSKFAESAFMNIYKSLSEAPDPKPLLEASIDSVHSAGEASRLSTENARLAELASKYADYDHVKAKLLKLEQSSIESAHAKVQAKEAEMKALMDEQERSFKLKEEELTRQVQELKANSEVTEAQLELKHKGNDDGDKIGSGGGRIAELELVARDLERANGRVLELEKRNLELRSDLEAAKSGTAESDAKQELERQISDLEGENAVLAAKVQSGRAKVDKIESETNKKITNLERDLSYKTQESESLRQKMSKQEDYDEIKRELDVLKSIQFSVGDDENEDASAAAGDGSTDDEKHKLEKMLLARNKKLNDDLTMIRVANNDLNQQVKKLKEQVGNLTKDVEKQRELNAKLEHDLSTTMGGDNSNNGSSADTMSMVSGWNWNSGSSTITRGGRASPTSSIIGGAGSRATAAPGAAAVGASPDTNNSILPIITQQRDRFRTRNAELEQELKKTWQNVTSLRKELETVKQDNMDLYEKTRYASSFRRPGESVGSVEDRYKTAYEEGLSPFQQFKGREHERALSRMGPVERITYSFTKIVLANRVSRNLFMLYCLALHLLVMTVVFHGVGTSSAEVLHTSVVSNSGSALEGASGGGSMLENIEKVPAPGR